MVVPRWEWRTFGERFGAADDRLHALAPTRPSAARPSLALPPIPNRPPAVLPKVVWKKIAYPKDGMIVAVDPDIPDPVQRMRFRMEPFDPNLVWFLNGKRLGPTTSPQNWAPKRGTWRLTLRDRGGKLVDEILFEVR